MGVEARDLGTLETPLFGYVYSYLCHFLEHVMFKVPCITTGELPFIAHYTIGSTK